MLAKLILPEEEKETLEEALRNHPKLHFRNRVQAVLLRADDFKVAVIAKIFKTRAHTVYEWFRRYDQHGFMGLIIRPGRGVKSKLNLDEPQIEVLKAEIKRNPQSLREVSALLSEKFGFTITKPMLKKYLKKN
jgi:transposase